MKVNSKTTHHQS